MTVDPAVALLISTGGALLFGSAAVHKVASRGHFAAVVRDYRLLPDRLVSVAATGVVLVEIALAIGLASALVAQPAPAVGALRPVAAAGAIALLVIYAAAMEINLLRGRRSIDCGCGGFGRRSRITQWMVIRNLLLAGLSGCLELPVATRALTAVDVLTVLGGVLVAALLYLACDTLSGQAAAFNVTSAGRS